VNRFTRLCLILAIVFVLAGIDQVTKIIAMRTLQGEGVIDHFGGLFRWYYTTNPGAFLSLGSELSDTWRFLLLTGLNSVILFAVFLFLLLRKHIATVMVVALSLILAGGVGNLIDRVFRDGHVIDFMNLGIGNLRTGVFNVADLAIVAGLVLLIFAELFSGHARKTAAEPESE